MLRLSGTVYLKTFAILYHKRHLPIYHTQQMINYSLSLHLSFTPNLRLISASNHSHHSLLAPFHSGFSGSLNLVLFLFHITIIITVSLISSHFICYTAYYCSIASENKPPSSFHSCLIGFYRHSKSVHSSSLLFSHLISSYVNIFCRSHFILWGNRYCYRYHLRNTILTKKTSPTIDLSLIFLSYLNLLSVLLRTALLRISLQIISSIHINLPTPSIMLLSLLFLLFTTTSLKNKVNVTW